MIGKGLPRYRELPPRARRIPGHDGDAPLRVGTTSACAENTITYGGSGKIKRNYLRVRGEYFAEQVLGHTIRELPPRARRILGVGMILPFCPGTTSACAENTLPFCPVWGVGWNYLRVRGEYLSE